MVDQKRIIPIVVYPNAVIAANADIAINANQRFGQQVKQILSCVLNRLTGAAPSAQVPTNFTVERDRGGNPAAGANIRLQADGVNFRLGQATTAQDSYLLMVVLEPGDADIVAA